MKCARKWFTVSRTIKCGDQPPPSAAFTSPNKSGTSFCRWMEGQVASYRHRQSLELMARDQDIVTIYLYVT